MKPRCFVRLALIGLAVIGLTACAPYQLRGRVVEGSRPGVEVVSPSDPRLAREFGVADAELRLTLDPDRLSREVVGRGVSGSDGSFALGVDAPGAGVLIHEVELTAQREGFAPTAGRFELPGKNKRVLVTVKAGKGRSVDERSFLEQTMEEAEPYLRD